jgi:hypothetical protein
VVKLKGEQISFVDDACSGQPVTVTYIEVK